MLSDFGLPQNEGCCTIQMECWPGWRALSLLLSSKLWVKAPKPLICCDPQQLSAHAQPWYGPPQKHNVRSKASRSTVANGTNNGITVRLYLCRYKHTCMVAYIHTRRRVSTFGLQGSLPGGIFAQGPREFNLGTPWHGPWTRFEVEGSWP